MNILFVCTGNTCRSCMAEAIANSLKDSEIADVDFSSAGIYAVKGQSASQNATSVMAEMGIDLSYHIASPVTAETLNDADLVLTLTQGHKRTLLSHFEAQGDGDGEHDDDLREKVFTLMEYAGEDGDIADPFGGDIGVYRNCAIEIKRVVERLIRKIKESKGSK